MEHDWVGGFQLFYFTKAPDIFVRTPFKFCSTTCVILLNDVTDLHLLSLGTILPEAPWYVFYATRCQVYCRFDTDDMAFASTLILYHT